MGLERKQEERERAGRSQLLGQGDKDKRAAIGQVRREKEGEGEEEGRKRPEEIRPRGKMRP